MASATADNCKTEGCSNECVVDGPAALGYCEEHKCRETRCDRPAVPGSRRCAGHTCEALNCLARVLGGDPGTVDRFCERHRICAAAGCGRFTFTRDNGQACLHCGNHYCHTEGCESARQGGAKSEHCAEHTCVEQGCHKGLDKPQSSYCKNHECKTDGCRFRKRTGSEWCMEHKCARPGCDGEGIADHYCEKHMVCSVSGCDQFRLPDGDGRCDLRESVPFQSRIFPFQGLNPPHALARAVTKFSWLTWLCCLACLQTRTLDARGPVARHAPSTVASGAWTTSAGFEAARGSGGRWAGSATGIAARHSTAPNRG